MPKKEMNTLVVGTNEYEIVDATARNGISNKQDTLVSGTNIKTINNTSLLGSGNITVGGDTNVIETVKVNNTPLTPDANKAVNIDLSGYATTSDIPENTGDLTNNGDGTQGSLYATQTWVQNYIASLDANNTRY